MLLRQVHSFRKVVASMVVASAVGLSMMSGSVLAEDVIDQEKLDNISQNCSSIKQSLTDLRRADSRTRAYLGSAYESVARDFITPLNLRLVKNNRVDTKIFEIQSSFSEKQNDFRSEYTAYMRELDNLIAINCQEKPEDFYRQLEKTREHRTKLHSLAEDLNRLVSAQYQNVSTLKGEL